MTILQLDSKTCMSVMLLSDAFDTMLLTEGDIITFNQFHIDGFLRKEFIDSETEDIYSRWSALRQYCLSLIKGDKTPLYFKFVFSLPPEEKNTFMDSHGLSEIASDVQGLYLNIIFDGTKLTCTSGLSRKSFTMDKTLDTLWDEKTRQLFTKWGIGFEPLA